MLSAAVPRFIIHAPGQGSAGEIAGKGTYHLPADGTYLHAVYSIPHTYPPSSAAGDVARTRPIIIEKYRVQLQIWVVLYFPYLCISSYCSKMWRVFAILGTLFSSEFIVLIHVLNRTVPFLGCLSHCSEENRRDAEMSEFQQAGPLDIKLRVKDYLEYCRFSDKHLGKYVTIINTFSRRS